MYNDKTSIPPEEFIKVKNYFIEIYGGLSIDSPSVGYWRDEGMIYKDDMIEYTIFIKKNEFNRKVKTKLNKQIEKFKEQFQQLEILCYYHSIMST